MRTVWQTKKLAEVCQIKPPKKEAKELLEESDLVSFVPMNDLGVRQKWLNNKETKALREVVGSYTYFGDNDVLLAKITPCFENGKLGIAQGLKNGIGFGSSEYIVFRSKGEIDPEYLFYFLSQDSFRDAGAKVMTGAVGHKRVPKEFIENHKIPLPEPEEQKRIVAILDEAFAGIDTAIANTEKNLTNARELFESIQERLLTNDESYEVICLGEVTKVLTDYHANGAYSKLKEKVELKDAEDFAWMVRSTDFENNFKNDMRYISKDAYGFLEKSKVFGGEIIMSKIGNAGKVYLMPEISRPCSLAMNLFLIRLNETKISNEFAFRYMKSKNGEAQILSKLKGTATLTITKDSVRSIEIPLWPREKQDHVVSKLYEIEKAIRELENVLLQKLSSFYELKQSLLQKAFSGELTAKADKSMDKAVA
ncbi:restriction endonuclease subunit S [Lacimicrobium alkaliphilum]|uniref:Type I restriction modification DNA specificity domain-containing protein n=1 Tax=Lacimicrobium alkaliphilum TaxID=1526571 RepID=A0ABQ1RHA0_9ALTE|nr:restriction endonuclease subunit S [Lacimicrobium alkaliphilum]GGD68414.1 hypothetical protein GCM10011357_24330 [Lacimicrobium alkaliphilum]